MRSIEDSKKNKSKSKSKSKSNPKPFQENLTDPKRKILYFIKVMQQASLVDLAKSMKISRMGVHKHLSELLDRGLVQAIQTRKGVGRPVMVYSLSATGKTVFPKSYSEIATHALSFIERKLGNIGVETVLRERQNELYDKYYSSLKNLSFEDKVSKLARMRDEEGYIAESRKDKKNNTFVLLEYNCPIIMIAENHWEACKVETELFEKVLDAEVNTTHKAAKGDSVCKFIIKRKMDYF